MIMLSGKRKFNFCHIKLMTSIFVNDHKNNNFTPQGNYYVLCLFRMGW